VKEEVKEEVRQNEQIIDENNPQILED
jgi:hypothetical protein